MIQLHVPNTWRRPIVYATFADTQKTRPVTVPRRQTPKRFSAVKGRPDEPEIDQAALSVSPTKRFQRAGVRRPEFEGRTRRNSARSCLHPWHHYQQQTTTLIRPHGPAGAQLPVVGDGGEQPGVRDDRFF